jgi:hypothetical protein
VTAGEDRHGKRITVHLPVDPPVLTREVARILLEMLLDATEIPVLDGPEERGMSDC